MEKTADSPIRNHVLAGLPESDYQRLLPHLTAFDLPHGKILYETGETIEYVYFPSHALISLVRPMADGKVRSRADRKRWNVRDRRPARARNLV